MKKLLFAGIAVSMLAACSNDEVVPVNNDSNAISFGVKAENGTRAADIFCNNNKFSDFKVFASINNQMYINDDAIVNQNGKWENTSGMRYWPAGDVTFFGYKYGTLTYDNSQPQFKDYQVKETVAQQEDLMYAKKTANRNTADGQVVLNFRHALSQIVFNAKNTNPNLYVEITGVSVVNVYDKGTYTFPEDDSDVNIEHPSVNWTETMTSRGSWEIDKTSINTNYSVGVNAESGVVELVGKEKATAVNLTDWDLEDADHKGAASEKALAMLLLPSKGDDYTVDASVLKNTHFLLKCRIFNVADGTSTDLTKNVCLWGKEDATETSGYAAKDALIPFTPNWEEGKKYTYTFVFGNGNGGIDPENPDNPVLLPITWDVTVDEFKDAIPQPDDVEMDAPELPKKD